jgi:hypothetical protein
MSPMNRLDDDQSVPTPIPLLFAVCMVFAATTAQAQTNAPGDGRPDPGPGVDPAPQQPADQFGPRMNMAETLIRDGGLDNPILDIDTPLKPITDRGIGATLRFGAPPRQSTLDGLREAGVEFRTDPDASLVKVGSIYSAFVPWDAFDALRETSNLERVEAAWYPSHASPLEDTGELVGAEQIRRQTNLDHDGEGLVIGDIDSNFDIFHPHFFRADGGTYHWRDQKDGDGALTPGTDGVDVDGNGTVDDDETLQLIDGAEMQGSGVEGLNRTFEPRTDWLFVDTNGDGRRNVGTEAGFSESTPAYGEPIFVADDVDRDGKLEEGEPLVRLDTSKFRRVVRGEEVYRRGENLIEFGIQSRDSRPTHGTSSMSVLVGGQPQYHDRVGLAPAAEVVGYSYAGLQGDDRRDRFGLHLGYLDDAKDGDVDVMLHEWSDVKSTAMDGSSNLETAMDELSSQGMLHVTPMGNLNTSGKHTEASLEPGQTTEVGVEVTDGLQRRGETYPYRVATMALYWRNNGDLELTLKAPSGETLQVDGTASREQFASVNVVSQVTVSPGGTHHASINVYDRQELPQGQWKVMVGGIETAETMVGRLGDGITSWGRGLVWNNEVTDHGTLCFPASADSAIGVAAYGAKGRGGTTAGELQEYSSRGPRIDGASVVDVAAPSDAWTALGISPAYRDQGFRRGWFRQFGGTSGAGPHVAGAAALVKGAHPDWSSSKIKQELRDHAVTNSLEPFGESLPNRHWGAGKIDAFKTLTGEAAPDFSKVPSAAVQVDVGSSKVTVDASGSSAPQGGELDYRFDVENDGEWDTSWRDNATAEAPRSAYQGDGDPWARVEVRTEQGLQDGALTSFDIQSNQNSDSQNGGSNGGCGGCRTSGTLPVSGSWLLVLAGLVVARFRRHTSHNA